CLDNTINLSFKDVDAEGIFVATKNSYAMSNGSACVSGTYAFSYVLKAMGLDEKRISEAIRISWDYDTVVDFSELVFYIKGQQQE
ncbi:MAG: cysteine desulfurase DndA, partial [Lachnospiraceae bacterium]|nr:cysteine desulfurase DndA [Lachnospiraceae bacterium]